MFLERQVWRAGGVPYYFNEEGNVLMMFMVPSKTDYNQALPELTMPQIAKGRMERFEQPLTAAIRECGEELGLREDNVVSITECGVVLGRTYMYGFHVKDLEKFDRVSSETETTMWLTFDEFMATGRELHKPVVEMLYNQIIEQYFECL